MWYVIIYNIWYSKLYIYISLSCSQSISMNIYICIGTIKKKILFQTCLRSLPLTPTRLQSYFVTWARTDVSWCQQLSFEHMDIPVRAMPVLWWLAPLGRRGCLWFLCFSEGKLSGWKSRALPVGILYRSWSTGAQDGLKIWVPPKVRMFVAFQMGTALLNIQETFEIKQFLAYLGWPFEAFAPVVAGTDGRQIAIAWRDASRKGNCQLRAAALGTSGIRGAEMVSNSMQRSRYRSAFNILWHASTIGIIESWCLRSTWNLEKASPPTGVCDV